MSVQGVNNRLLTDDIIAKEALRLAMHKLPLKCKIVSKEELEEVAGSEN